MRRPLVTLRSTALPVPVASRQSAQSHRSGLQEAADQIVVLESRPGQFLEIGQCLFEFGTVVDDYAAQRLYEIGERPQRRESLPAARRTFRAGIALVYQAADRCLAAQSVGDRLRRRSAVCDLVAPFADDLGQVVDVGQCLRHQRWNAFHLRVQVLTESPKFAEVRPLEGVRRVGERLLEVAGHLGVGHVEGVVRNGSEPANSTIGSDRREWSAVMMLPWNPCRGRVLFLTRKPGLDVVASQFRFVTWPTGTPAMVTALPTFSAAAALSELGRVTGGTRRRSP